jgi:hypothetical protein
MSDDELTEVLVGLQRLVAQVEAVSLAVVCEVDRRDLGRTAGATSTANWISGLLRMRPGQANRRVTLARDLDSSLAQTQTALEAGSIGVEAADIIAQTIRDLHPAAGPQVRVEAERVMLDHARTFDPRDLLRIGKTILHTVDPELADQILATQLAADEQRADRARDLSISDDPYTTASFIRGKLDPITTDMLRTALEPLAKPRPTDADGPDTRSPGQRLGDGLHELLRRYLDSGASPTHGGEKPHLIIRIDADHLTHHTGYAMLTRTNTPISTHTATRLACDATITYWPTNPPPATDPPGAQTPPRPQTRIRAQARSGAQPAVTMRLLIPSACSPARPADSSNSATKAAPSPAATAHPPGAKPTTSSPGSKAAPPPSTTASSSAATTTASSTNTPGTSGSQPTATPNSSHPNGSTPTKNPNATTHSACRRPATTSGWRIAEAWIVPASALVPACTRSTLA